MIWFTADTHFGHKNIIRYCNRPFGPLSIKEHDETLAANWNSVVRKNDVVYHLGDIAFLRGGSARAYRLADLVNSLNGKKYLILGNHDREKYIRKYRLDVEILGDYYNLTIQDPEIGKVLLVLCHYPFERWNKKHFGSTHLHGHCHGTLLSQGIARMDVGVDCHNYAPVSYDTIKVAFTKDLMASGM